METPVVPWALVHRNALGERAVFELTDRTVVVLGRSALCDLALIDPRVSRRHATIQLVEDQHLLRDEGSSNGTFLNGFRLTPERVFVLREGDVIEIGNELLVYGKKGEVETPSSSLASSGASFPLAELVQEGRAALDASGAPSFDPDMKAAFEGVGRVAGFERALELTIERLEVHGAAIFLEGSGVRRNREDRRGLRLMSARPNVEAAAAYELLVAKAIGSGEGQLIHGVGVLEGYTLGNTHVHLVQSIAVAPFPPSTSLAGAIAGSRSGDAPLDRLDLARLAAIADSLARHVVAHQQERSDTRLGFRS